MALRITLIEDQDGESLSKALGEVGGGELKVTPQLPPEDISLKDVLTEEADLYLVDYELDTRQANDVIVSYRGTTLAARLREIKSDYPIVLLTRSDLSMWESNQRIVETGRTFDEVLYKDKDLVEDPIRALTLLLSIAQGYEILRNSEHRTVSALLGLLETDRAGRELALESRPPSDGWKVVEASYWIRSILLRFPGVTYDAVHAATALGMTVFSFNEPRVQELFDAAQYRGPFCDASRRWWRHRLFDIANEFVGDRRDTLGLYQGLRAAASEEFALELEAARDVETDLEPADTVCYFLNIPIRLETSLPYRPDERPPVMDEARVSFKAIRERNDVEANYFDEVHRNIMVEIQQQGHDS